MFPIEDLWNACSGPMLAEAMGLSEKSDKEKKAKKKKEKEAKMDGKKKKKGKL